MFGFKSKKDKRIEELERLLVTQNIRTPRVMEINGKVETVAAGIILQDGMPIDYAKRELTYRIAGELQSYITYDIGDDDGGYRKMVAYLKVVTGGNRYDLG